MSNARPTSAASISWHEIRELGDEIKKVMDNLCDQVGFGMFRPGLARAIAGARAEHMASTARAVPPANAINQV